MFPLPAFALGQVLCLTFLAVVEANPYQTYLTEGFKIPVFNVTRSGAPVEPGALFLTQRNVDDSDMVANTSSNGGPYICYDDGTLIWHGPFNIHTFYNFNAQTLNGSTVLSFWSGYPYESHGYGNVTILDANYNFLYKLCLPYDINASIRTPQPYPPGTCFIDKHESFITDRNTILVTVYNSTMANLTAVGGPAEGWVYDAQFYEIDIATNTVLFSWSSLEHVDITETFYLNPNASNPLQINGHIRGIESAPWDYFHINSVALVNGNYLINSRYTFSFYLINGNTGDVIYTVEGVHGGDFTFSDPSTYFSFQHNPRIVSTGLESMTISLFNNDNVDYLKVKANGSSGYVFTLNLSTKTASTDRFLQDPNFLIYSDAEGSYQTLPSGHALLGYGSEPVIQEFDENNNVIYTAVTNNVGIDVSVPHSYRAYRLPWSAQPTTNPKTVARFFHGTPKLGLGPHIRVAMSWNGATTYTKWNILAGKNATSLRKVASNIPKAGFETVHNVTRLPLINKFVAVQAVGPHGKILATSRTVAVTS